MICGMDVAVLAVGLFVAGYSCLLLGGCEFFGFFEYIGVRFGVVFVVLVGGDWIDV